MLHLHRAERADGLARALAGLLAQPPVDPFTADVVCVPTRGMERWLTQQLSAVLGASPGRGDGICANVEFPSPRALVRDAVATAAGMDPDADPWLPERAVWPLLEVVADGLGEPWMGGLATHLGGDDEARRSRRFATVRHVADLFDAYALHRPAMVRGWAEGRIEVPAEARWQAELWRRLRRRLDTPSPAERVRQACDRLVAEPSVLGLPERVALFGLTRMPHGHLDVLAALAGGREVHLFLLHPSAALWEKVAGAPPVVPRSSDLTSQLAENRLLASWGQDSREMQLTLRGHRHTTHHHPVEWPETTLLQRIQADVRRNREAPGAPLPGARDPRLRLDPSDRSIQVHACHGRARQVEVLRDTILHLLEADATLQPRDVIVMCPDIETFAPLIHATFGAGETTAGDELDASPGGGATAPDLRVRLADRSLRRTNPVLGVVAELIDLAARRVTASEVLDLADREPVRRRFGLDDEDLARMRDWVSDSGIRWGLDAGHRAPFNLQGLEAGTWRSGLDRLLLGVTMTEEGQRLFEGVLPADDVESGAIDLVGRVAELVHRLERTVDSFAHSRPVGEWAEAIADAADALTAPSPRDAWQRAQLQRILDAVVDESGAAAGVDLSLPEVRALLADRLQGRPTRANFRTGHLTVCTLVPMRSIPHRVVCLLGLDDGAFPRKAPRDGDDLMLMEPRVGERDPRVEDRQMLLDALMAAGSHLVITYTGNDVRTNARQPPAVPVGELLDHIGRTATGDASAQVLVRHPLQPFDARNFEPGRLLPGTPWSFDRVTLEGARAAGRERAEPAPFLQGPLPPAIAPVVELDDLVRFVRHPVRAFLRRRLGIGLGSYADEVADALPVELDKLEEWQVGERLVAARLAGAPPAAAEAAERARGSLPPGRLADPVIANVRDAAERVVGHAAALAPPGSVPSSVDVRVILGDGRLLSGTVPDVHGSLLRAVTYSRVGARHRLVAWVRFLAATAAHPDRPFEGATVGRAASDAGSGAAATVVRLPRLDPGAALEHLTALVDLFEEGMREPVPMACRTSAAFAYAARRGADPVKAAAREWESSWEFTHEDQDLEHQLVFGRILSFDELRRIPGFATCAGRLWDPLLDWERVEHR